MGQKSDQDNRQIDMLHGALLPKIILFALPLAASSMLQQLFNAADVAVVGRFAGGLAQAAVGSTSSMINLLVNLFVGLSVGTNAVIARHIGRRDEEGIRETVHTSIALALGSGISLLILGQGIAGMVLEAIHTPWDVLDQAVLYIRIYFLGMPFIMLYNFGAAILRGRGDTRRPLFVLMLSGVVNVLLNLVLVIVFHLGVAGVGAATVLSNIISSCMILYFLIHEEEPFRLKPQFLGIRKKPLKSVAGIGVPAGIQGMVFSLSNVCIQGALNGFGAKAMAGVAIAMNFEMLSNFVIGAFSQAAVTFTSQNYGAGQHERCRKIFRICILSSMLISGFMNSVFILGRGMFLRIFTADEAVMAFASGRMRRVLSLHFLTGTYDSGAAALRGIGYSVLPTAITIVGTCLFRLIWICTVFVRFRSFEMLMNVYPASWLITGTAMLVTYCAVRKKPGRAAS